MKKIYSLFAILIVINAFSQTVNLDTTFGINGKTTTTFGENNNMANAVISQPDGKIIVGGSCITFEGNSHFSLARYNTDGTLDVTFGTNGKTIPRVFEIPYQHVENGIHTLVLLPSGKFLALGTYGINFSPSGSVIARFNSDGSIDTTFGQNGRVFTSYTLSPFCRITNNRLEVLPDGKFIMALVEDLGFNISNFGIERYTEDGVLDTTFGNQGHVSTSFGNGSSGFPSMSLLADGKFIVTGTYQQTNQNFSSIAVAKYNADGSLDTSFDGDGRVLTLFNTGAGNTAEGMHVSQNSSGKIVVTSTVLTTPNIYNFGIVQYNANGSLDTAFDGDGKALNPIDDQYNIIIATTKQTDGKYLVTFTNISCGGESYAIRRYNPDATLDTTFGTNGKIITAFGPGISKARKIIQTSDSKIVVVGNTYTLYKINDVGIAKFNDNGTFDISFGTNGIVISKFDNTNDELTKILVQQDDKLVAVGTSKYTQPNNAYHSDISLSKYNSNGTLDTSFGTNGKKYVVFGENINSIYNAVLQPDNKILVANSYNVFISSTSSYELIRFNTDGNLDTTFGTNGKINPNIIPNSIIPLNNDKILVSGYEQNTNNNIVLKCFNSNGTTDTTFGTNGVVNLIYGESLYNPRAIVQSDGKIILSCSVSSSTINNGAFFLLMARYTENGNIDTTFGTNGIATTYVNNSMSLLESFIQPDGKIILSGSSVLSSFVFSTVRFNTDGTIDTSYGANGIINSYLDNSYTSIKSIKMQSDGKFLVGLSKSDNSLATYNFVVKRFNTDGSYDFDFSADSDGIFTSFHNGYDEISSIALQSDNKIVFAGTTDSSLNRDFALTRYTNDVLSTNNNFYGNNNSDFIVYPNPVKDILNIKIPELNDFVIIKITIYNMLGQDIFSEDSKKTKIDVSNLKIGVYNIKLFSDKGDLIAKFIKE